MKWKIPAKTFLVGEYAALVGAPALVLTTTPCFELSTTHEVGSDAIHPESPAGRWWANHPMPTAGFDWHDPYQGIGGLGASSAQFLAAYLATQASNADDLSAMLDAYYQSAWQGLGVRPSGYDVLAQSQHQVVYIHRQKNQIETYSWGFQDIGFLLLHSGKKLATHEHLQTSILPESMETLTHIVEEAKIAFQTTDSQRLVDAVNHYHDELKVLNRVADNTITAIKNLCKKNNIVAAKGCGAMGADVFLLVVPAETLDLQANQLQQQGWRVLATSRQLYAGDPLMKKKLHKPLELLS